MAARAAQTTIRWITADEETETTSWDALAAKINAPAAKKGATEASHRVRVLNRLGMDGWELTRRLRKDSGLAGLFVMAVSGYGAEPDIDHSYEAGCDLHLTKPVDPNALEAFVARPYSFR